MVQLFFGTRRQGWEFFRGNNNAMAMLVVIDTSLFERDTIYMSTVTTFNCEDFLCVPCLFGKTVSNHTFKYKFLNSTFFKVQIFKLKLKDKLY